MVALFFLEVLHGNEPTLPKPIITEIVTSEW